MQLKLCFLFVCLFACFNVRVTHNKGTLTQLQKSNDESQSEEDIGAGDYKPLRHDIRRGYGRQPEYGSTYHEVDQTIAKQKFVGQLQCNFNFANDVKTNKSNWTGTLIYPRIVLTCAHLMPSPILINITTELIDTNKIQNHGLKFKIDKQTETLIVTGISTDSPFKNSKLQIGDIIRSFDAYEANDICLVFEKSQQFYTDGCNGNAMRNKFQQMWSNAVNNKQTIELQLTVNRQPV